MKKYRPGTVYKVSNVIVRAKTSFTCKGCLFDDPFSCPNVLDQRRVTKESIPCRESSIIFVKP